ncbi:MAG TPA: helix-turn-helix domain-containing protein [Gemmatimonadaceae bacterium]|jgi:transposase|nr:helix-turn-helix domain-containing protein [Gemmatimonadaceae bacterium]
MYDATDIQRVRALLEQGWSKAAIAKHLRISRRVIYNWAASGYLTSAVPEPRVRAGARSKLDAYESVIARRLSSNPATSTRQILRELRDLGYTGEITQLRTFLSSRRRDFVERTQASSEEMERNEQRPRHVG